MIDTLCKFTKINWHKLENRSCGNTCTFPRCPVHSVQCWTSWVVPRYNPWIVPEIYLGMARLPLQSFLIYLASREISLDYDGMGTESATSHVSHKWIIFCMCTCVSWETRHANPSFGNIRNLCSIFQMRVFGILGYCIAAPFRTIPYRVKTQIQFPKGWFGSINNIFSSENQIFKFLQCFWSCLPRLHFTL